MKDNVINDNRIMLNLYDNDSVNCFLLFIIEQVANCYFYALKLYQNGVTPLHGAAYNNSKECLDILLSHGAELNIKDRVSNENNMT